MASLVETCPFWAVLRVVPRFCAGLSVLVPRKEGGARRPPSHALHTRQPPSPAGGTAGPWLTSCVLLQKMGMTEDDKRNCCLLEIQETEAKYYRTLEDIEKVGVAAGATQDPCPLGGPVAGQGLRAALTGRAQGPSQFCTPGPAYPEIALTYILCPLAPRKLWAPPRPVSWEARVPPPTPRLQLGPGTVLSLFLPLLAA